jgi:hypothetical protein
MASSLLGESWPPSCDCIRGGSQRGCFFCLILHCAVWRFFCCFQVSKPRGGSDRPRRHGDDAGAVAQDLWQRLQSMYQVVIKSRAVRKPAPHELDPKAAAQALVASVRGLVKAATSPYVIDKLIKCASAATHVQLPVCVGVPAACSANVFGTS